MKYPQLISILIFTISEFCLADDTLSPGQTLSDDQTLISTGEVMELGFFSPGTSKNKFLGIWYKNIPDIVVWVANRNNPLFNSKGVLTVRSNGTLVLSTTDNPVLWSSSSYRATSNPILKLLDTGNLVLVDESMTSDESSRVSYIWQSFDFPGDTRLPEMQMVESNLDSGLDKYLTSWKSENDPSTGDFVYRIENKGLPQPQMTILMGTEKRYRSGPWNGYYFTGLPFFSAPAFTTKVFFGKDGLISISERYNSSIITRLIMNHSGYAQRYIMNERTDSWNLVFEAPSDSCDNYGHCGPNGICRIYEIPTCECLSGFRPKSQREWSILEWSSGCTRILPSDCQKEDGFLKVETIKFPDPLNFKLNASMSPGECQDECLKQCNCTAFADPYMHNRSSGCLMWFGDLIDVRELTGKVTYPMSIHIRVPISELANTTDWNEKKKKKERPSDAIIIGITTGIGLLVLLLISLGIIILWRRRNRQALKRKEEDLELPLYDFTTIAAATNFFSHEKVIGEGGFGPVYKGDLSAGQVIAVKRMSRSSGQGPEEFRNEVILIAKLQHRNLVRILGCCIEGEERMLIYEYMENRSLDSFIFDQKRKELLTWPKRFDIIMGIARGLLYLHHDSRLKVIHRDLKTSNILLDGNLNAKISDFGLARMFEGDQTTARTQRVVGTYGYMAPEYVFDGRYSIKSDVFSLGVVLLEIVSGKKNRGLYPGDHSQNLLGQAWLLWKENRELELMDACYSSTCVETQVKRCIQVGLFCVQCMEEDRPNMSSVVVMLSSEDNTTLHPLKEPGSLMENNSKLSFNNTSASVEHSNGNMMTITQVAAR